MSSKLLKWTYPVWLKCVTTTLKGAYMLIEPVLSLVALSAAQSASESNSIPHSSSSSTDSPQSVISFSLLIYKRAPTYYYQITYPDTNLFVYENCAPLVATINNIFFTYKV